jgi:uncharacterized protein YrrD
MSSGEPASYLTLREGTPVLANDGSRIGVVEHVLADADADIFDGLVIDTRLGPGGHRFVDAPQVATIAADAVTLTLSPRAAEELPEPSANPATMRATPGDTAADETLGDKLRHAWDVISGNR